jgi:2-polyprenyl-6-methoxyphenol hydroxylase-like FAD-dependent oxidoreductase
MTDTAADVLIVGAGPTGLTLACVLAQRGVRVRFGDLVRVSEAARDAIRDLENP